MRQRSQVQFGQSPLYRHPVLAGTACALALLVAWGGVGQSAAADEPKESQTAYGVRVEITEVKNRIVEGTVRGHVLRADQPKAFGADDTAPTPPETLAFAVGSCVVSTGRLIALMKKLPVEKLSAVVEAELDFAKAMGIPTQKRAGFSGLKVTVSVEGPLSEEEKKALIQEATARCPMCDNLSNPTPVTIELLNR